MTPEQLYAANLASCVGITVNTTQNIWGQTTTSAASGSGFVLSLKDVEGGAVPVLPGGDEPVQGGDDAVGEGVGQLAQRVADGVNRLTHHQRDL